MSYRIAEKSKKVLYIDISEVPAEHVEWFIKGAEAAIKAVEAADETNLVQPTDKSLDE